jgi:hypothetical protein
MIRPGHENALRSRLLALRCVAMLATCALAGCASGSFSSSGSGTTGGTPPPPSSNPPSLPTPPAATVANDYVGTQIPGSSAPQNTVAFHVNDPSLSYTYRNVPLPGVISDSVPNTSGIIDSYQGFLDLGATSGIPGQQAGAQYFGMAVEDPSRYAFFAYSQGPQLAAMVPKQTSSCVTPTAAATYDFVTLFGANFLPATDAAWGTVQLSASGSIFSFAGAKQHTESGATASTGQIPFAASKCTQSSTAAGLGYFIDTPASAANGNTEMRSFLGPTGLLVANLQGADSGGNPLPLPGLLGMVEPSTAPDPVQVSGSTSNPILYRVYIYQPANSTVVTYGLAGHDPQNRLTVQDDTLFSSTHTTGMLIGLGNIQNPNLVFTDSGEGVVFGKPDPNHPGLFPNAKLLDQSTTFQIRSCPSGSAYFGGLQTGDLGYCASPAVAMVGLHDGKYIILITSISAPRNNSPTVLILVQN